MRRRILLVVIALASLAGVAALLWLSPAQPEVSLTTVLRLTPGMSEADVAAVLGPPTSDRTDQPLVGVSPSAAGGRVLEYAGDRATAMVEFGPDGQLVRIHRIGVRVVTPLERLRLRLNWW
jgi:hypothetical protein